MVINEKIHPNDLLLVQRILSSIDTSGLSIDDLLKEDLQLGEDVDLDISIDDIDDSTTNVDKGRKNLVFNLREIS